jgi:hypothetical protein
MRRLATDGLICLKKIPKKYWKGLKVYHPMLQIGTTAYWKTEDYPADHLDDEDEPGYCYDEGVIISYSDTDEYGDTRVLFNTGGCKLRYGAYNLWVFKRDIQWK